MMRNVWRCIHCTHERVCDYKKQYSTVEKCVCPFYDNVRTTIISLPDTVDIITEEYLKDFSKWLKLSMFSFYILKKCGNRIGLVRIDRKKNEVVFKSLIDDREIKCRLE